MNPLIVSETAILYSPKLKQDHDAINGIKNGYYPFESDQVTAQVGHAHRRTWSLFH